MVFFDLAARAAFLIFRRAAVRCLLELIDRSPAKVAGPPRVPPRVVVTGATQDSFCLSRSGPSGRTTCESFAA